MQDAMWNVDGLLYKIGKCNFFFKFINDHWVKADLERDFARQLLKDSSRKQPRYSVAR